MNEILSSKNNSKVKYVKKLLSSSSFRKSEKSFVIEGLRLCEEALKSEVKIKSVFFTHKFCDKYPELIERINASLPRAFLVSEDVMKSISDTDTPQGIVCVCEISDDRNRERSNNIVALENVQNPSNLGSIFRTCDALGVKDVIISSDSCDIYNPKVLRGSMGAVFRLNIWNTFDFRNTILKLKEQGYKIYVTVPSESAEILDDKKFNNEKCVVVLGNEGNGVTQETIANSDIRLTIPMTKEAESLNVSVAAGIVIWEMSKHKG